MTLRPARLVWAKTSIEPRNSCLEIGGDARADAKVKPCQLAVVPEVRDHNLPFEPKDQRGFDDAGDAPSSSAVCRARPQHAQRVVAQSDVPFCKWYSFHAQDATHPSSAGQEKNTSNVLTAQKIRDTKAKRGHNGENQVANHNGSNHRRKQLRRWQKNALQPLASRRMLAVSISTRNRRGEA